MDYADDYFLKQIHGYYYGHCGKNNPREIKKIQLAVPFGHPVAFRSEFFKYNQACLNAIMAVAPDFKRFLIS